MKYNINLHIIRVMSQFIKTMRQPIGKHIRDHGITENQFMVLEMLYAKGTLTMNEIIERTQSSDGNIAVVINNLLKAELIEKKIDEQDRRIRRISLSEKGFEIIDHYFPLHVAEIDRLFSRVSSKDKEELINLLKKIGKKIAE